MALCTSLGLSPYPLAASQGGSFRHALLNSRLTLPPPVPAPTISLLFPSINSTPRSGPPPSRPLPERNSCKHGSLLSDLPRSSRVNFAGSHRIPWPEFTHVLSPRHVRRPWRWRRGRRWRKRRLRRAQRLRRRRRRPRGGSRSERTMRGTQHWRLQCPWCVETDGTESPATTREAKASEAATRAARTLADA